MVLVLEWIEKIILIILIVLSIWSISILIDRFRVFSNLKKNRSKERIKKELQSFHLSDSPESSWTNLEKELGTQNDLFSETAKKALAFKKDQVEMADREIDSFLNEQKELLSKGLVVLATLGSNAPFIGLFGTVLGIIRAFAALSETQSGTSEVMSGISWALIATAAGLFVAIPALISYNYFSQELRKVLSECHRLKDSILTQRFVRK